MIYSIIDPTTNIIIGRATSQAMARGRPMIPGEWPIGTSYVKSGVVLPLPPTPGGLIYQWNKNTEVWDTDLPATIKQQRQRRDQLLTAVDQVNPLWFASLTAEQQAELAGYRSALLAVPQQPGFPTDITWPAKPRWL